MSDERTAPGSDTQVPAAQIPATPGRTAQAPGTQGPGAQGPGAKSPEEEGFGPAVTRFRVVPAAYVLLVREGAAGRQVLLQYRSGTGYMDDHWACGAAGHVERGESVWQAAIREAHEELGIVIRHEDLEPMASLHRSGRTGHDIDERVDWFFTCRRWQGRPQTMERYRSVGLTWVDPHDLDSLSAPVVPHERYVISRWAAGTLPAVSTYGFDDGPR